MNKEEVYKKAIELYGCNAQIIVAMEELSELIQALSKFIRCDGDMEHIAEEMADVEIVTEQLKLMFQNEERIADWKEFKINRLNYSVQHDAENM